MANHNRSLLKACLILQHERVRIEYVNWRGEHGFRTIKPLRIEYGSTSWHPEAQHLLVAIDLDKKVERSFAVKDIGEWQPDTVPAACRG